MIVLFWLNKRGGEKRTVEGGEVLTKQSIYFWFDRQQRAENPRGMFRGILPRRGYVRKCGIYFCFGTQCLKIKGMTKTLLFLNVFLRLTIEVARLENPSNFYK